MLQPFTIKNKKFLVHPFRAKDVKRFDEISEDIFNMLTDEQTLRFIPEKRLYNIEEAKRFLRTMILNFYSGRNYMYFISDTVTGSLVGMIDLISPELAEEHYTIKKYPHFVEFYLKSHYTGCQIMTELLPSLITRLADKGISKVGAIISPENFTAKRVLEKSNFIFKEKFNHIQDLYELAE